MKHELKILPEWYETLLSGVKTFEVRKDDREPKFQPRDELLLREFDGTKYTGRTITATVTLVLRNEYCKEGYCIMSVVVTNSYPTKPQTHFDRIKAMSVEEMAKAYVELIMQQKGTLEQIENTSATVIEAFKRDLFIQTVKWLESEVQ